MAMFLVVGILGAFALTALVLCVFDGPEVVPEEPDDATRGVWRQG